MCDIPLDLQRKFEQRWAARFARPAPPVAPKEELEGQDQPPATRGKVRVVDRRLHQLRATAIRFSNQPSRVIITDR